MKNKAISIRPFLGAQDFEVSRNFYLDLGFQESIIDANLSFFKIESLGFYLQRAYVKDWVDNTMVFLEVEDVESYWETLLTLNLTNKYKSIKLVPIRKSDWGSECFVHDPSGILWHIGEFNK